MGKHVIVVQERTYAAARIAKKSNEFNALAVIALKLIGQPKPAPSQGLDSSANNTRSSNLGLSLGEPQ